MVEFEPEEEREVWDTSPITRRTLKNIRLQQVFVPWTSDIFYGLSSLHLDYRGFIPNTISIQMGEFLEVLSLGEVFPVLRRPRMQQRIIA